MRNGQINSVKANEKSYDLQGKRRRKSLHTIKAQTDQAFFIQSP
jgi:hypothetical protein